MAGAPTLLSGAILIVLCGAITVADLRTRRIPDCLTLALAAAGIAAAAAAGGRLPVERCAAALVAAALLWSLASGFRHLRGTAGLGMGDVKMAGAAALWVSPWNMPLVILVACITALLAVSVVILRRGPFDRRTRIPFGPFIGAGLVIVWCLEASGSATLAPGGS